MGILDTIEGMVGGQQSQGGDQSKVAGGLMGALQDHPGGIGGMIQSMQGNGMGEHVQNWQNGQQTQMSPEQVQQGLGGTGLIENVAQRAGISPQMAQMGLATILPMVISHFSQGGQVAPQSQFGGLASQLMSRFL